MARTNWYPSSPPLTRGRQFGRAKDSYPHSLSDAQLGIWFAQAIDPSNPAYNIAECLEIHGPIDAPLFESALRQVVNETEALCVRIVDGADGPRQFIAAPPDVPMSFIDVSHAADPRAAAEQWMTADLATPIDPAEGPLFAYALFKAAADRFFWYSRYHHIVMDGFGLALMARRVADVYSALAAGLSVEPGTFGSLVHLLEEEQGYRASKRFEQDRRFWMDYLAGLPEAASLGDGQRSRSPGFNRHSGVLPFATVEHLHSVARRTGVGLPQLVTAAAAVLVHRLTGAQDILLALPLMARMTPLARCTPGMMSNVLPVRLTVRPNVTVSELVGETARRMRHVVRHQRYNIANLQRDFERVADQRAFGPTVNFMPFDYTMRFHGAPATAQNLSDGPVEDLSIALYDRSDSRELRIDFDGNPALYSRDRLADLQQRFLRLLAAVAEPDRPIGSLEILAPAERHRILREWNDTARAVPRATLPAAVCRAGGADARTRLPRCSSSTA